MNDFIAINDQSNVENDAHTELAETVGIILNDALANAGFPGVTVELVETEQFADAFQRAVKKGTIKVD